MPLPEYPPIPGVVPKSAGIGLDIPERKSDCSGVRPSWYPFQANVCDEDAPDPEPLTERQKRIPGYVYPSR